MRNSLARIRAAGLGLLALLTPTLSLTAQTTAPDELNALREQMRLLDQKLKILERNIELKDEAAEAAAKKQPVLAIDERGLSITSGDKAFSIRAGLLLQADHRYYADDKAPNGFQFRRVRPTLQGTVHENFSFRVTPEFAGSNFQLLDATLSYKQSEALILSAGKFKAPFDLERLRSGANLTFIERAYPSVLGPNREIGVQVSGDILGRRLNYAIALGNGVNDGGNSITNPDEDLEVSARLFATPFASDKDSVLAGLGFGLAATYGHKSGGTPSNYAGNGQQTIYSWLAGTASDGTHFRWSPQLTYYRGPFGLLASYVVSEQSVTRLGLGDTLSNKGWLVQGSYVLTGENASYGVVVPDKPFKAGAGNWGAFEIAARASRLDIDDDAFVGGAFANPAASVSGATSLGLGVNWYLNRNVKAALDYEYSRFKGGAAGGADRPSENAIFSRIQLSF